MMKIKIDWFGLLKGLRDSVVLSIYLLMSAVAGMALEAVQYGLSEAKISGMGWLILLVFVASMLNLDIVIRMLTLEK
jgi:hypothetical protein